MSRLAVPSFELATGATAEIYAQIKGPFGQSVISSDVATSLPTVQFSPIDSVKRHSTARHGIVAESFYAPVRSSIQIHYNAPIDLLVLYEDGARREGETSIDGLPPSRLRKFGNKLTFVPAGHSYREWHETSAPLRVTHLYLSRAKLQKSTSADATYFPRVFFEDLTLWTTAIKLKSALESNNLPATYLEALVSVLAHELSCLGQKPTLLLPENRGGLAGWQTRAVTAYLDEHLDEKVSLVTLARLAGLSQHHFCRAFKQSVGIPPHGYHLRRRIEHAKVLLSDLATSITDVSSSLGYSNLSSFSLAFRKITGQAPSRFRKNLK
jgi:AraC family transcriptional regulator